MRTVGLTLLALFAVLFLGYVAREGRKDVQEAEWAGATTTPGLFSHDSYVEGTITYYPNNVGTRVPYLVYKQDPSTRASTRAIAFTDASYCETNMGPYPCPLVENALETYYGAGPVRIFGTIVAERILVDRIEML